MLVFTSLRKFEISAVFAAVFDVVSAPVSLHVFPRKHVLAPPEGVIEYNNVCKYLSLCLKEISVTNFMLMVEVSELHAQKKVMQ